MGLRTGTQLGPYEILSAIGAGGMGEVYRARDTRLDRIVAVKILPDHLSDRAELRERFEREARTIASLNHAHICTLHDIGQQDGTDFLVMECLEGETLAERLKKGPLPLDQVLQYAIEIADALDKAHRKGITHRDLKPANIMLTKSGTKLLDFGLAKLRGPQAAATNLSALPTEGSNLTAQGSIVGTLQYMAPEQLEGGEVDARTDIFAFGVVVHEMATGKKAFEGKSQASLIAKILETDPTPISSLQPMTPPALDRVIKTCLAKEPAERWQAASDLCRELKWIAESGSTHGGAAVAVAEVGKNWLKTALWAGAAVAACIVVGFAVWNLKPAPARPAAGTVRFLISPPETWSLKGGGTEQGGLPLAVSPDGQRIAFVATSADGKSALWVRSLDALTAQPLAGTEGASSPFWSPSSRFLGFFAGGKLKKIEVSGGAPITLCDAPDNRGGTWSRDGVIVFAPTTSSALQRVPSSGGAPTAATVLGEGETGHLRPSFLPDGRHFLYRMANSFLSDTGFPVYLASLDSRERKLLLNTNSYVVYSAGHLLYLRETTLMAQPFDARRLVMAGDAFPIAEQIQTITNFLGIFSAAENGVLAYQTDGGEASSRLEWFDRSRKQIGVLGDSAAYTELALSPDGKRTSVSISDQTQKGRNIWLFDLAQGLRTRFTFGPTTELESLWSPDGSRIIFNSNRKGHFQLYQKSSTGAGTEEVLLEDNSDKYPTSWSPDGHLILYTTFGALTGGDLYVLPVSGDRKPVPFLKTPSTEDDGQFSPDGRWVAYQSNESGRNEVYVTAFPGPGGKWQISRAGGVFPRWRHDGTEVFYLAPEGKLMAAAVNGKGSSFEVGAVRPLFETRTPNGSGERYVVSADGQRFLINTALQQSTSAPITVVLNWTAGLKK